MDKDRTYKFPVWGTQGGGLVREANGMYVFVEAPTDFPELGVGDELPEQWSLAPANELARAEMERDDPLDYDPLRHERLAYADSVLRQGGR